MKLTRAQEKYLIEIGLQSLLDNIIKPARLQKKVVKKKGNKWSAARHKKYAETMAQKWDGKRKIDKK